MLGDTNADAWQILGSMILVLGIINYKAANVFLALNGLCLNNRSQLEGNTSSAQTRPTHADTIYHFCGTGYGSKGEVRLGEKSITAIVEALTVHFKADRPSGQKITKEVRPRLLFRLNDPITRRQNIPPAAERASRS